MYRAFGAFSLAGAFVAIAGTLHAAPPAVWHNPVVAASPQQFQQYAPAIAWNHGQYGGYLPVGPMNVPFARTGVPLNQNAVPAIQQPFTSNIRGIEQRRNEIIRQPALGFTGQPTMYGGQQILSTDQRMIQHDRNAIRRDSTTENMPKLARDETKLATDEQVYARDVRQLEGNQPGVLANQGNVGYGVVGNRGILGRDVVVHRGDLRHDVIGRRVNAGGVGGVRNLRPLSRQTVARNSIGADPLPPLAPLAPLRDVSASANTP